MNIFEAMKAVQPGEVYYAEDYDGDKDYEISVNDCGEIVNGYDKPYIVMKTDLDLKFVKKLEFMNYLEALEHLKREERVIAYDRRGKHLGVIENAEDLMQFTLLELHGRKFTLY